MNHITNPMRMPNPLLGNTTMQRQSSQQQYQSSLTFRSCQDTQTRTGLADATAAHASATTLRRAVGKLLNRYLADYGDRLSKAELARMRFLAKDADRQLGIVETRTATTQRLARSGASRAAVYRSAKAAELAFTKAQESSVTTLDEVQPMLQSKLGLFEALSAKGDLDEQMARYDALGVQIRKVSAAYAP